MGRDRNQQRDADKTRESGRIPPQHLEAEQSVLGAILLDNAAFFALPSTLRSEDFYFTSHRTLFKAMSEMVTKGNQVDSLTLTEELLRRGESGVEASYIASLSNIVPSTANAKHYAGIVADRALRRRIVHAHNEIVQLAHEDGLDTAELQRRIEELLAGVDGGSQAIVRSEKQIVEELVKRVAKALDNPASVVDRAFTTGMKSIDDVLRLGPQDLFVVAADSGGGKSVFMSQVARHVGMGEKARRVLVAPLEMSGDQMTQRRLMDVGNMFVDDVYKPRSEYALQQFLKAAEQVKRESRIEYIERCWDLPTILREAARQARTCHCPERSKNEHAPDCDRLALLIVDYLQILDFERDWGDRRDEQIGKATRALKRFTGIYDVPVMFASQLRRHDGEIPRLHDLRESGNLGNDANAVGILYRPSEIKGTPEYKRRNAEDMRRVIFLLEKQRMGQAHVEIELVHHFEHARFAEPVVQEPEPEQKALGLEGQRKPYRGGAHS